MSNLTDIRAIKLHEASKILTPALAEIYLKYGLDLTTTLLMYYAAKGIIMSKELTQEDKRKKLEEAYRDYIRAIKVLNKAVDKTPSSN